MPSPVFEIRSNSNQHLSISRITDKKLLESRAIASSLENYLPGQNTY